MSNQLFKNIIPKNLLMDLLEAICEKKEDYYILNRIAFKKAEYYNLLDKLTDNLKDYYYKSKHFYLTRKLTYNYFLTIIRQLCNSTKINYNTKICYNKSTYDITYHIHIN
jgi:hypothetical protein